MDPSLGIDRMAGFRIWYSAGNRKWNSIFFLNKKCTLKETTNKNKSIITEYAVQY